MLAKLLLTAALTVGTQHTHAAILNVTHMSFDGGTFVVPGFFPPGQLAGSSQNLVGGYHAFPDQYQVFVCDCPMSFYTSDGTTAPFGGTPTGGGPTPTATVDTVAGTLTIDLSSWTGHWNGTNFAQGASHVTGTWNPVTGAYAIGWSALIIGGVGGPYPGIYTLRGVAAVPETETYALMLAGLALVGIAVRHRARHVPTT